MLNDGPNHDLNFRRGILNARNNLKYIVKGLRNSSVEDNYLEYLEVYVPKLEGTEYYDEFKKDLDKLTKEYKKSEELTEASFRLLSASDQKKLIDEKLEGTERADGDDSNADKRVSLYFS